jgi:hypothetical protein
MPTPAADKPWYSIESGPVHFTVMSTENNWTAGSEQYNWIQSDLASVNRSSTPWLIFTGHRPAYSSYQNSIIDDITGTAVDTAFPLAIEPLLLNAKVDLAIWGHVHNYERTCAVYQSTCLGNPTNTSGIDTYNNTVYTAPVHAVIGTAGFTLDPISTEPPAWSLVRIGAFGYTYIQADPTSLLVQVRTIYPNLYNKYNGLCVSVYLKPSYLPTNLPLPSMYLPMHLPFPLTNLLHPSQPP